MRKNFITIILIFSAKLVLSQTSAVRQIDSLISCDFFKSSNISVNIFDLTARTEIYRRNTELLLVPASNMKILTSAAALLFLGTDYKFKTSVFYTGEIDDDEIDGDLYFVGGCDPEFNTDNLRELIRGIKNLGITEIDGDIYGDVSMTDSLYWGQGWMWDDDPAYYSPFLTPLTINKACIKIIYSPGCVGETADIQINPDPGYIQIINNLVTVSGDTSVFRITRNWLVKKDEITAAGFISVNSDPDTLTVNLVHPEINFMALAGRILIEEGIEFDGEIFFANSPSDVKPLISYEHSFDQVIDNHNKESDNLNAEMTLRALAYEYFGKPATAANGLKIIDSLIVLCGLDPKNYLLADGSGLSRYNLISTELIIEVLKYFYSEEPGLFERLIASFAAAGKDGTLKNRMKGSSSENNVFAKTGSMSGISSLSGFLLSKNQHKVIFSVMIQNFVNDLKHAYQIQDEICRILSESELP